MPRNELLTLENVLDNLAKPLKVEVNMGYRDISVIGGFSRYMQAWSKRGTELTSHPQQVAQLQALAKLFEDYTEVSLSQRRERIRQACQILRQLREINAGQRLVVSGRKPADRSQSPAVSNQQIGVGGQQPNVGIEQPTVGSQQPTVGSQQPTVGSQQPTVGSQQSETGSRQSVASGPGLEVSGTVTQSSPHASPHTSPHAVTFSPTHAVTPLIPSVAKVAKASKAPTASTAPTAASPPSPPSLESPVQFFKGVGPHRAALLKKCGVETVLDLITYYPRRHEDRTQISTIAELKSGEKQSVFVTVTGTPRTEERKRIKITKVPVADHTGTAYLVWFNQPYMESKFFPHMRLFAYGQVKEFWGSKSIQSPEVEMIGGDTTLQVGRIVPIYPLTQGLQQNLVRGLIHNALQVVLPLIGESLPEDVRQEYNLAPLTDSFLHIHFPDSDAQMKRARRRLVFEEFLMLQLALALRQQGFKERSGISFRTDFEQVNRFIAHFPFQLTGSQKRALAEIQRDMVSAKPMNRLLHGEVGSGKTVVAAAALYTAVLNGYQGAFMAPTEILAEQHYRVLRELFEPFDVDVTLLIGGLPNRQKSKARKKVESGEAQIAVGTHALIQEQVDFANLGFAVVDEQHRFGVMQRANLIRKGACPDVLVMTATPIPRTLALTVYGDLDVSVLRELPPGRKPVKTYWLKENQRARAYEFVRKELEQGRQGYIVCPLIEESEKLEDVNAVLKHADWLQKEVFPEYKVGVLHGRLSSAGKDEVMQSFRRGEIQVLTTTTVIEVGVDVPNASVIVIEDAQRFGLAQLHQLRGRVGRSVYQSYCLLIGSPSTEEGRARLKVMTRTNDGFEIAEEDLRLRGPGEFYGTRQHGLPDLRIAHIIYDVDLLTAAREAAFKIVAEDPTLSHPKHLALRTKVLQFFEGRLELVEVS